MGSLDCTIPYYSWKGEEQLIVDSLSKLIEEINQTSYFIKKYPTTDYYDETL